MWKDADSQRKTMANAVTSASAKGGKGSTTLSQNALQGKGRKVKKGQKQRRQKPRNRMVGHQYAISR